MKPYKASIRNILIKPVEVGRVEGVEVFGPSVSHVMCRCGCCERELEIQHYLDARTFAIVFPAYSPTLLYHIPIPRNLVLDY